MIARAGTGWQTTLADLSLILFMVMAAAVQEAPAQSGPSPRSEPVAVWKPDKDAPPLDQWLSAADPRAALTITVRYGAQGPAAALERARALAAQAGARGVTARIVIEPGEGEQAVVAFDAPMLARGLQEAGQDRSDKE